MANKNIAFLIASHHPYIKHSGEDAEKYAQENTLLFQYISGVYIPLLNMLGNLEKDNVQVKISMVFSAPLCTLLTDEEVKEQYVAWLDNQIEFAKKEIVRTQKNSLLYRNAEYNLAVALENRRYFNDIYEQNLLKYFSIYSKKGYIEILATAGTYAFLPHYQDMEEVLNAQVETGINAVRSFFGTNPDGFYLPELGYAPGIENVLKNYGIKYTVLPAQSFLFSKTLPSGGVFIPCRTNNSLNLFASYNLELDYESSPVYRNISRDIAWELECSELTPFIPEGNARFATGWSYWNNSAKENSVLNEDSVYNVEKALNQVSSDAQDFVVKQKKLLEEAVSLSNEQDVTLTCVFDTKFLGYKWTEGIVWLEKVLRLSASADLKVQGFSDILIDKFNLQKIEPYPAAFKGSSYGEKLVSNSNSWLLPYLRKASERIVDLSGRFPDDTGLKVRLLNLGARQLMISQDERWSEMIEDNYFAEYAELRFKEGITAFTQVYDALGSNTVSTEWLCSLEKKHPIFPWMNYRIFSKKR